MLIYCRNLSNCDNIYMWLMESLQDEAYVDGGMHYSKRMVELYHSRTESETCERVLTSFKEKESNDMLHFGIWARYRY